MVETTQVRGCCPLDCQDTCSWVATVQDGVVTSVRGAKEHPFTRGGLCAKVRDYEQRTYAKERLLQPLLRSGPKGSAKFTPIGWPEALAHIAERFQAVIEQFGAEAIMPLRYLGSMGMVQQHALMRVFNALGCSRLHGDVCGAPGFSLGSEGHPIGFDWETVVHSDVIVLWGANLLSTCHHHWHFVKQARRRGARVISIDPRVTRTTRLSDQHITLRPGTDALLAAGIIRHLLHTRPDTVARNAESAADFEAFQESIEHCTPEFVADACGVSAGVVEQLAEELSAARSAAIRCGVGPQQCSTGDTLVRTLSALSILTGQHGRLGGGLFIADFPALHEDRVRAEHLRRSSARSLDMTRLGSLLVDTSLQPPVKALMCWNTNPAVILPDSTTVRRGLAREDLFTVVVEHFLTDTARYADVVLPSTTQLEHFDLLGSWGHSYISVNQPAVAPRGETKSHGEIMRALAAQLGLSAEALRETDEEIALSALPKGTDTPQLLDRGWLKEVALTPTPHPNSLRFDSVFENATAQASFQLLTPKAHHFLNSSFANMSRHRTAQAGPCLEINPSDAARLGIAAGDEVWVQNSQGRLRAVATPVDGMHASVVAIPGKWWSESDPAGAVTNDLTPPNWSVSGQPTFNDTFVSITPVKT